MNSLLEVEVKVLSTGLQKKAIIQSEENKMSEEEARQRFERLQYLKQNPRDDEENKLVIYRASRMYEEAYGADKTKISDMLAQLDEAMANKSRLEIEIIREKLTDLLDSIEQKDFQGLLS